MLQTLLFIILFITTPTSVLPVTFSYYQAVPAQTDNDPSMSACGSTLGAWEQVAIHRDLRHIYPCGTLVFGYNPLVGFKVLVVNDITARHTPAERWDVLVGNDEPALEYGLTQGWIIGLPHSP